MYRVRILWDEEADVWIAESNDIPGLVLEDASLALLVRRVLEAAPELLEWNRSCLSRWKKARLAIVSRRV